MIFRNQVNMSWFNHILTQSVHHKAYIWSSVHQMIQVDIGGHPPFPTRSKQFSGNFGNLLFLAVFNFRGHFEGLNEGFFGIKILNDS
jgi:hypothetical protein